MVERLFDLKVLWADIDAQAMPETARIALLDRLAAAVGNLMSDVLRTGAGRVEAGEMVASLHPGVDALRTWREHLIAGETRERSVALRAAFVDNGAPEALAARVADLFDFDGSVGLASLALRTRVDPVALTRAFPPTHPPTEHGPLPSDGVPDKIDKALRTHR